MNAPTDVHDETCFWRDGNDATERDASWTPFIDNPMHPEYPSGHSILAGTVGAVLEAEIAAGLTPPLTTTSPTAKGAARRWTVLRAAAVSTALAVQGDADGR